MIESFNPSILPAFVLFWYIILLADLVFASFGAYYLIKLLKGYELHKKKSQEEKNENS